MDLPELKAVYDELWADAKSFAGDLKRSISMTLFSAYASLIIAFTSLGNSIPFFVKVATGNFDILSIVVVSVEIIGVSIVFVFSRRLFKLHSRLEKKYSKLIKLEMHEGAK
jgi:Na+/H+-translocating membrane pyrophosphatase